jgi:hypothetical protein
MNISKSKIPLYLTHQSSPAEICVALGLCSSRQVGQLSSSSNPLNLLVDQGLISTRDREYVCSVQAYLHADEVVNRTSKRAAKAKAASRRRYIVLTIAVLAFFAADCYFPLLQFLSEITIIAAMLVFAVIGLFSVGQPKQNHETSTQ